MLHQSTIHPARRLSLNQLQVLGLFMVMGLLALALTFYPCRQVASAFAPVPLVLLTLYVGFWAGSRRQST